MIKTSLTYYKAVQNVTATEITPDFYLHFSITNMQT